MAEICGLAVMFCSAMLLHNTSSVKQLVMRMNTFHFISLLG